LTAALLALSGGAKIRDPGSTRGALAAARLPARSWVVYGLALAEIVAAAAALAGTRLGTLALTLLYFGFSGFVGVALVRNLPVQSCGCFGKADTPPTALHLIVNLTAAFTALWVAARGGASIVDVLAGQPAGGLPYLFFLAVGTFLLSLTLTRLATLGAAIRGQTT